MTAALDALEVPTQLKPKELDAPLMEETHLSPLPIGAAKDIASTLRKLGLKKISAQRVKALADLGVYFPPASINALAKNGSVVTQQGLLHAYTQVMRIFDEAESDKTKLKVVSQVGFLAKILTATNKQMAEIARKEMPRPQEPGNMRASRFPVGQIVVNINGKTTIQEKAVTCLKTEGA